MSVELVGIPADGGPPEGQFHSTELENVVRAINGAGVLEGSIEVTATGLTRVITIPAFTYWAPDGAGALVLCSYVGGTVTMDDSEADPRTDILVAYDDNTVGEVAGVATPLTGDVVEPPEPAAPANGILVAKVAITAQQGPIIEANIQGRAIYVGSQASKTEGDDILSTGAASGDVLTADGSAGSAWVAPATLTDLINSFISDGVAQSLFWLGPANNISGSYTTNTPIGLGCAMFIDSTSASIDKAASGGGFTLSTGTTSGEDSGFESCAFTAAQDWTMVAKVTPTSAASQNVLVGMSGTSGFGDGNNIIAFRISGTGNVIGVCDAGGTETTRDSGATYTGVEIVLEIRVRSGGTVVQFFIDGVQVGADVTDNIPAGAGGIKCGIVNSTTADKTLTVTEFAGWREAA